MLILIVDDDPMVGKILRMVFQEDGFTTGVERSALGARTFISGREPDLLIMDAVMPGVDGFNFCRELRSGGFTKPIIFLTGRAEVEHRIAGLSSGADDYVVKPFDASELLARVQAVLRRTRDSGPAPPYQPRLRVASLELDTASNQVGLPHGESVLLTPTESRLLECLMRHPNQVVSRDTLIEWVWGYAFEGNSNRVEVYIRRLRQKLKDQRGVDVCVIETSRGRGYRLVASLKAELTARAR